MNCQYLIGICSKTHLPCPHCRVDGKCETAECANAVVPTWNELIDIYTAAVKPTKRRLTNIVSSLKALTLALGTQMNEKVTVTDEQMDTAYASLMGRYSTFTVCGIFDALKATTSRRRAMKIEANRRVKQLPEIELPEIEKRPCKIVQLTPSQRVAINERLSVLRSSQSKIDHTRFVWMWFAFRFGMRPVDIGTVTWSCISTKSNGSVWLDYIPTKTATKTGGRRAGCRLTDDEYAEIAPFVGNAADFVIPRHANRRPKGGCSKVTSGDYVGYHASLRKYVIAFMKSIGVDDPKPQYALRKDCSQRIIKEKGLLHEAQLLGHSPKIALANYTNLSSIELKSGL